MSQIERPRVPAREVRAGDRLLASDALDPRRPGPAFPLVHEVVVAGQEVTLRLDGWVHDPVLPADATVLVERFARDSDD